MAAGEGEVRTRFWTRGKVIGGIVGGVLFLVLVRWAADWALDKFNEVATRPPTAPAPFDGPAWRAGRSVTRVAMAQTLVEEGRLLGLDEGEVEGLLGPPDDDFMGPWIYVLRDRRKGELPSPELGVRFEDRIVIGTSFDHVPGFSSKYDLLSGRWFGEAERDD